MPGRTILNNLVERSRQIQEQQSQLREEQNRRMDPIQRSEIDREIWTTIDRIQEERPIPPFRSRVVPRPRPIRITRDQVDNFIQEPVEELREREPLEDLLEDNMARKTIHEKYPEIEISDALYLTFYKSDYNLYYIRCINNEKGQDTFIIGMHRNKEGKLQMELVTHPRNEWFNIDKNTNCITVKKDLLKQEDK